MFDVCPTLYTMWANLFSLGFAKIKVTTSMIYYLKKRFITHNEKGS